MNNTAMQGLWTLTAPDGRTWQADGPLRCVANELRERVPPEVAMERIFAEVEVAQGAAEPVAQVPAVLAVLTRGQGGAFTVRANMDALRAIYELPPGEHSLYAAPALDADKIAEAISKIEYAPDAVKGLKLIQTAAYQLGFREACNAAANLVTQAMKGTK